MLSGGVTRSFTYGNTGNVTLDDRVSSAMTLTYNSMDRLVRVSAGSGPGAIPLADYVYAANGQRVAKTTPAGTTHYLYEPGGALFAETDGAGAVLREYVTLGGATLAVIDGGFINFVHGDHLSTAQKMTDGSGAVVWDASYRPFGEATVTMATGAPTFNLRFPGQYYDAETELHYNYFRDYDPTMGRYVQSDPIGLQAGWNTYAYVGGNPTGFVDSRGLEGLTSPPAAEPGYNYYGYSLSWDKAWKHYFSGGGGMLYMALSEVDREYQPTDFPGIRSLLVEYYKQQAQIPVDGWPWVPGKSEQPYRLAPDIDGPIGHMTFVLKGFFTSNECSWVFSGYVSAANDSFNFDPKIWGARDWWKEVLTMAVHYGVEKPGLGTPFPIQFEGKRAVRESREW